jgi:hypothetical protein
MYIEGACIFRIVSGVTCGDREDQTIPIELEVQRVNTTPADDAAEE